MSVVGSSIIRFGMLIILSVFDLLRWILIRKNGSTFKAFIIAVGIAYCGYPDNKSATAPPIEAAKNPNGPGSILAARYTIESPTWIYPRGAGILMYEVVMSIRAANIAVKVVSLSLVCLSIVSNLGLFYSVYKVGDSFLEVYAVPVSLFVILGNADTLGGKVRGDS